MSTVSQKKKLAMSTETKCPTYESDRLMQAITNFKVSYSPSDPNFISHMLRSTIVLIHKRDSPGFFIKRERYA
jgi:hypothetical protein